MKRQIKFDSAAAKLQGPIIDWCGGLQYTEIYKLDLQDTSTRARSPVLVVDISLTNGSMYRLQREIQGPNNNQPRDTIDNLLPSRVKSQPRISIDFSEGKRPDLLFVLSVCYGIYKRDELMGVPAGGNFFALALVLNVARMCLPPRVLPNDSAESSVELLWNDVFGVMERRGHAFWADTTAEQAKIIMHRLISKVAQGKILAHLSRDPNELDIEPTSIAMPAVARVEALVEAGEVSLFSTWDEAWDDYWRQFRSQATSSRIALPWAMQTRKASPKAPISSPTTPVTGRQAGRLPSRVQLHTLELSNSSVTMIRAGLIGAHWSREFFNHDMRGGQREARLTSRSVSEESHARGPLRAFDNHPITIIEEDTGTVGQDSASLGYTRQALSNRFVWMSAVEIAMEKAWDSAWPVAVGMGESAAKEVLDLQASPVIKERVHTEIPNNLTILKSYKKSTHPAVRGVLTGGNLVVRWLSKLPSRVRGLCRQSTPREQVPSRSSAAKRGERHEKSRVKSRGVKTLQDILIRVPSRSLGNAATAHSWMNTAREYEKLSRAEKQEALQRGREKIERYRLQVTGQPLESEPTTLAEKAWKSTPWAQQVLDGRISENWKEAWIKAWKAVWNQTWDAAVVKGVEFGVEKVLPDPQVKAVLYDELRGTSSHKKVETDLGGPGHPSSSLEQFYSMTKKLHHLFESHQNATHALHYDYLRITIYPSEENHPSSFGPYAQELKAPQIVSHLQLQNFIVDNYLHVPGNPREGVHESRAGIREIWIFARSAYRNSRESTAGEQNAST